MRRAIQAISSDEMKFSLRFSMFRSSASVRLTAGMTTFLFLSPLIGYLGPLFGKGRIVTPCRISDPVEKAGESAGGGTDEVGSGAPVGAFWVPEVCCCEVEASGLGVADIMAESNSSKCF